MKILMMYVSNTYNYGTMMMAENLITYINKKVGNKIEYYIDAATIDHLDRLKQATKYDNIYISTDLKVKPPKNKQLGKLTIISRIKQMNNEISDKYDYIFVLGGDDFSEFYMGKTLISKIRNAINILSLKWLNKNNNVILLGQTIGPYTGFRKIVAKKVFPKIKIYTRDSVNLKVMEDEYKIKAKTSRDLAFLDLCMQEECEENKDEILNKYNLQENEYITIVGTDLLKCYTSDNDCFYKKFVEIIKTVKNNFPSKKIVWLSHVCTPEPTTSDNTALKYINEKYDNFINNNMTVIDMPLFPAEARTILGHGYFTLTCRMHAAVSTFQIGKPAICLSYSPKYKGVISDGLNMEELVIEAKGDEIWRNDIVKLVNDKIVYIEKNYEDLTNKIKGNVLECKQFVNNTLDEIVSMMMEGRN